MTYFIEFGSRVEGSVLDLSKRAHVRESRLRNGKRANVWLGDEIAGAICHERTFHLGRECWRWFGYDERGVWLSDAATTDKASVIRNVASIFLQSRLAVPAPLIHSEDGTPTHQHVFEWQDDGQAYESQIVGVRCWFTWLIPAGPRGKKPRSRQCCESLDMGAVLKIVNASVLEVGPKGAQP